MASIDKQNKFLVQAVQLADRLAGDILRRNLKPGETYFTAQEAARFLCVSGASANRALQLLEKRRIIQRSQRRGATILEPPKPDTHSIDHVYFLVHDKYYRTEGIGNDGILMGIQSELPTTNVSHCFLVPDREVDQLSALINSAIAQETIDAFVLVRASFDVQRMIVNSSMPAVVLGSVYQGIGPISHADRDHAAAVHLIADYLRGRGCSRWTVLLRQQVLPGDHQTLDALLGLTGFALKLRFTPSENDNIEAEIQDALSQPDRPDAFLCQTVRQAECVAKIRKKMNLRKSDLEIVVLGAYLKRGDEIPFPYIDLCMDPETIGRRLGTLLRNRVAGQPPVQEILPVKLVLPRK